ncbi:MAG: hypothetical protein QM775_28405 [Pirellulales bacterium]
MDGTTLAPTQYRGGGVVMHFNTKDLIKILQCDLLGLPARYKLHRLVRLYRTHLRTQNVFDETQLRNVHAIFEKHVACNPDENKIELKQQLFRLVDEVENHSNQMAIK